MGYLGVRAKDPIVLYPVLVLEANGKDLRENTILHPVNQGLKGGRWLSAVSSRTVCKSGDLEVAIEVMDIRGDVACFVVIISCTFDGNKSIGL